MCVGQFSPFQLFETKGLKAECDAKLIIVGKAHCSGNVVIFQKPIEDMEVKCNNVYKFVTVTWKEQFCIVT